MSDKTDETARAIAECQHVDFFNFDPLFKQERFADLQQFARFWLLRKEIWYVLEKYNDMSGHGTLDDVTDVLDKIKKLQ